MIQLYHQIIPHVLEKPNQVKFGKYEYRTGEEILPSNQKQIIEQTNFTYSPFGEAFEKQTKTSEDQGKKSLWFKIFRIF